MALQREDVYKGFRFTPYTTRKVLTWAIVVPGIVGYIMYTNAVSNMLHTDLSPSDLYFVRSTNGIGEANSKENP